MKKYLLTLTLLLIGFHGFSNNFKAIIKANVIHGENMTTAKLPPAEIEKIFVQELAKRGIKRVDIYEQANLFVDIFLYNILAGYPTMAVAIRTNNGLHYVDREDGESYLEAELLITKKLYIKMAQRMALRLPASIDINEQAQLNFIYLIRARRAPINKDYQLMDNTARSAMISNRAHYDNTIDWQDNEPIPFIANNFEYYLNTCVNYTGIRPKIKQFGPIILELKIDNKGTTLIKEIKAPFDLNKKEKLRLERTVAALPIWINDQPMDNIKLIINLK